MAVRTKEELRTGLAEQLKKLRESRGLSMAKMALIMGVDPHTYARYESGLSAPSVDEFVFAFHSLGEGALRWALDYLYPDKFSDLSGDDEKKMRDQATLFFSCVAGRRIVSEWCYIMFGHHGSNAEPQMEEFCMIDHLPLQYRYAIAQMVDTFWRMAESRGELIATEEQMPDVELFRLGLEAGRRAAFAHRQSYSTAIQEGDKRE